MSTLPEIPPELAQPAPTPEPGALQVRPDAGSRLEQLHAAYADAKAEADEASKKLKAITDAIKVELTSMDANERRFELSATPDSGVAPLRLSYVESWRFDSSRLKSEDPETYVRFAKQSGSWRLSSGDR